MREIGGKIKQQFDLLIKKRGVAVVWQRLANHNRGFKKTLRGLKTPVRDLNVFFWREPNLFFPPLMFFKSIGAFFFDWLK